MREKSFMDSRRQLGFGIIPVIVIIAAVVVLGFVGWRVFTTQSSSNTGNNQANNTQAQTDTYLDIKELGVKIKLSDGIKDAVYSEFASSDGSQLFAHISTKSLETQSGGSCSSSAGPLGSIAKATGTPEEVFGGADRIRPVDNLTTFRFGGDTYVYLTSPQAQCSEDKTIQNLADQQRSAFSQDFKTVQLDN